MIFPKELVTLYLFLDEKKVKKKGTNVLSRILNVLPWLTHKGCCIGLIL